MKKMQKPRLKISKRNHRYGNILDMTAWFKIEWLKEFNTYEFCITTSHSESKFILTRSQIVDLLKALKNETQVTFTK